MTATELKDWRARKGWTQREAAEAMGVSLRHYQGLEQGRRDVKPYHVKLTELLG